MAFSDIGANPAWGTKQNKRIDGRTYAWNVPSVRSKNSTYYAPDVFLCKLYGLGITDLNGTLQPGGGGGGGGGGGSTRPSSGFLYPRRG